MPLIPKQQYAVSPDGTILRITDKTGEYDVTSNPGGYGTPNPDLADSCWFALVKQLTSTGNTLIAGYTRFVYDPAAANTKETSIDVPFPIDGTFTICSGRLPVTTDGANLVEGGVIPANSYVYYNGVIYQKTGGILVAVADLSTLIDNVDILQVSCDDILFPILAIKRQALYKQYRLARNKDEDQGKSLFFQILKLREDLQGAKYTFVSGLETQAQDQIESLIDLYSIKPN